MEKSTFEKEYLDVHYPIMSEEDFMLKMWSPGYEYQQYIENTEFYRSIATQAFEYAIKLNKNV